MDCSPPGPRSWGFFRQEYWSGLPFSSPGDLPNPGTEPRSPTMQVDSLPSEPPTKPYVKWGIWAGWPQRYWSVPKILCWKNIHEMTWELANSSGHLCTTKYGRLWKQGNRFLCVCVCVCVCSENVLCLCIEGGGEKLLIHGSLLSRNLQFMWIPKL